MKPKILKEVEKAVECSEKLLEVLDGLVENFDQEDLGPVSSQVFDIMHELSLKAYELTRWAVGKGDA